MNLEYVPLLQLQRDLYAMPRGSERFQEYIRTMTNAQTGDLELPLAAMNPMGKEHLGEFLEQLLALGADEIGAQAMAKAASQLHDNPGSYRVALVVSDDLMGGWTNRYVSEFDHRFQEGALHKRGWIAPIAWTSETYTAAMVAEEVSMAIYRVAHIQQHGYAETLAQHLAQEGYAMTMAGSSLPVLEADDLAYTREVLASYLHHTETPILVPALFGDPAAHELGYTPIGLSPNAGFALALHDAKNLLTKNSADGDSMPL